MNKKAKIYYFTLTDEQRKEEKLEWFAQNKLEKIPFELIQPSKKNNWINIADNDFEKLMPVCSKEVKAGKSEEAIFKLFSLGVVTARDEWVYDFDGDNLESKVKFLIDVYNKDVVKLKGKSKDKIRNQVDYSIKWTRAVKNDLKKGKLYEYSQKNIIDSLYRPFCKRKLYFSKELNEMQYQQGKIFPNNKVIAINQSSSKIFNVLASNNLPDYHFNGDSNCIPLYRYTNEGKRIDNITQWALNQFRNQYADKKINREDIFHYVYGVLHNPAYRKKYELNLKREFPRIPFYEDFWFWAEKGKELMDLHLNYEEVEKYGLERDGKPLKSGSLNKVKLKAKKDEGIIILDEQTTLKNIPALAWDYKLGNRSALEWVLDQYKEKKPRDPTIREKFNTYRFADYKEEVIELLQRVCTVSVKTIEILQELESKV